MNSVLPLSLILTPILAVAVIGLFPSRFSKSIALLGSLATVGLTFFVYTIINSDTDSIRWGYQFLATNQLDFTIAQNGISVLLSLLVSLLLFVSVMAISDNETQSKGIHASLLLLGSFLFGVFSAQDLISFYIFWEASLIPMYFLIGIWGGADRVKANYTFFIFTMIGSLLLLVSVLYLGVFAAELLGDPAVTFVSQFDQLKILLGHVYIPDWVFIFVLIAFGVKASLFPLHSWLPVTYMQTSYPALIMLSGAMAKMGTYGILIFGFYFFQEKLLLMSPWLSVLAVIGILYAAWIASTRKSLKEIITYSSMSHMGFILLGLFAGTFQSVQGAVIQMFNHGISIALLFVLLAYLMNRSNNFDDQSGISDHAPVLGFLFSFAALSAIGLPGLNGFIGEFNILIGTFRSPFLSIWITVFATLGVILAAVYMLKPIKRVFYGESTIQLNDLTISEIVVVIPIVVLIVWMGLYPQTFFDLTDSFVRSLIK